MCAVAAREVELESSVREFIDTPRKMLIGGQWVAAESGKTFEVYNPATDEVVAHAQSAEKADVDKAVKAARKAFDDGPWTQMSPAERGRIVWKIGDLIMEHQEELAQLEALDNGKPIIDRTRGRCAAGRRTVPVHGRLGDQAQRRADRHHRALCARRAVACLYPARTGRRLRPDHPLELPAADGGLEARPGPGLRQHGGHEAGRGNAAVRPEAGRDHAGSRRAGRRGQHAHRLRRGGRRADRRPPDGRQDRLHRLHRSRPPDRGCRQGQPQEGIARTRRQVAEHHSRRRRSGKSHSGRSQRHLLQPRPVLCRRLASVRARKDLRPGGRRRGGLCPQHQARPGPGSGNPDGPAGLPHPARARHRLSRSRQETGRDGRGGRRTRRRRRLLRQAHRTGGRHPTK